MTHTYPSQTPALSLDTVIDMIKGVQEESHQLSQRSTLEPYELERLMELNNKILRILTFMAGEL